MQHFWHLGAFFYRVGYSWIAKFWKSEKGKKDDGFRIRWDSLDGILDLTFILQVGYCLSLWMMVGTVAVGLCCLVLSTFFLNEPLEIERPIDYPFPSFTSEVQLAACTFFSSSISDL